MRTLSDTLLKAQKAVSVNALVKIVLTHGATSYTYTKSKILDIDETEDGNLQSCKITLDNSRGDLTELDLRGYKGVLSLGVMATGEEYSPLPPMWVTSQEFDSTADKLICLLSLVGICNQMADDKASESYIPDDTDTKTIKMLVNEIIGATLDCFSHCTAYEVVWDSEDDLVDTYKPKDGFRIYTGNNRIAAVNRLLDYTKCVMRPEDDRKIHIFVPTTAGTSYDYEYSLGRGQHNFWAKALRNRLVIPNYIVVQSRGDDDPQYGGYAKDDESYAILPKRDYYQASLESDDQARKIAEAKLAKAQLWSEAGLADVPMNVGAEVYDYVKVTDEREEDYRIGNIGILRRHYTATKNEWRMTFIFGDWQNIRKALAEAGINPDDLENYFARLRVKNLYVENLDAYLDEIKDGPDLYIRQNWLHLDATGVYVSENTLYAIRIPGEAEHNLWKQDTAPTNPQVGDFWLDTNFVPDKVMIWDGDSWKEATSEELEKFGRATVLRRLKQSALTADGLIVLDEVQEGTYGLVLSTSIQAGHILLSKTVKDGKWYDESGVVLDATWGISLYGGEGINAFRSYPTIDDYEAGTNVQIYIGTDGKFYAGGGKVYLGDDGLRVTGEYCNFYDINNVRRGYIYGGIDALYIGSIDADLCFQIDEDIVCSFYENKSLRPGDDGYGTIGTVSYQWKGGYFKSRLKIPVGTDMYD
jgi:hypothetical protein